jgi:bifunctional DNA-binding transcriptional regulator/antitoxin component of YhaV-PrlF toxin-antitoxin module
MPGVGAIAGEPDGGLCLRRGSPVGVFSLAPENQTGTEVIIIKEGEKRRMEIMKIELKAEEVEMLREIVGNHLYEVRMEMSKTDAKEFRKFLEKRVDFLEEFLMLLDGELAASGKQMAGKQCVDFPILGCIPSYAERLSHSG